MNSESYYACEFWLQMNIINRTMTKFISKKITFNLEYNNIYCNRLAQNYNYKSDI